MPKKERLGFKYVSQNRDQVFRDLGTNETGLSSSEAARRLRIYGQNAFKKHAANSLTILWRQLTGNPLSLILAAAAVVAFSTGDKNTAIYVLLMIGVGIVLGFWNEFSAEKTIKALMRRITLQAVVMRDEKKTEIEVVDIVPGDLILLVPGSIIPADLRFIETDRLEINESALTGESNTVHKTAEALKTGHRAALSGLDNIGFMGTTVVDGWGSGVVFATGKNTEFGKIAESSAFGRPKTEFQKGLSGFGGLLLKLILIMAVATFAGNALLGRGTLTSLLFALAIAVGLTPELLPVVVTVGLAHGAGRLAKKHVISKQLIAIENLGNMDVLCTDKTGTLTEGVIKVTDSIDGLGKKKPELLRLAILCNSAVIHHKPIGNTIDVALWQHAIKQNLKPDSEYYYKTNIPFFQALLYSA